MKIAIVILAFALLFAAVMGICWNEDEPPYDDSFWDKAQP